MKKFASLMAGAAALAMIAAPAMAGTVYQGSVNIGGTGNIAGNINGSGLGTPSVWQQSRLLIAFNPTVNSNVSLITISGSSAGNNGTASGTDGATFT